MGKQGHGISGMKFHAPLIAIFLGLDWQKSESHTKSIYPKWVDFDVPKCDGAHQPWSSVASGPIMPASHGAERSCG
jgi:hypothetical protein